MKKSTIFVAVIFISFIMAQSSVLAFDTFKWQICTALNMSGGACDDWYNSFKGSIEEPTYNKTEIDNLLKGINETKIDNYYNKTEIDEKISAINLTAENTEINKTYVDQKVGELRDSVADVYQKKNAVDNTGSSGNTGFYIIIAVLVGLIALTQLPKIMQQKQQFQSSVVQPRIQTYKKPTPKKIKKVTKKSDDEEESDEEDGDEIAGAEEYD